MFKREFYIYLTTNKITGKQYVGQHLPECEGSKKSYLGSGVYIKNVVKKYGKENFTKEILKDNISCQTAANIFERVFVKKYNTKKPNGYNLTDGGGGVSGFHHTEEWKKQHSEMMRGYKHSDEFRKKISEARKDKPGHKQTEETRRKMSESGKERCRKLKEQKNENK